MRLAGSLSNELANVAAQMMPDVAADWCDGRIDARPQDDDSATITRELTKSDGRIDWSRSAIEIERRSERTHPGRRHGRSLDGSDCVHKATVVG